MKTNMSLTDRSIRLLAAVVLSVVFYAGDAKDGWWALLPVVAGILAASSIVGICLLYSLFGISTKRSGNKPA